MRKLDKLSTEMISRHSIPSHKGKEVKKEEIMFSRTIR